MPKIIFLPHQDLCPKGAIVKAKIGESILSVALRNKIEIEHMCERSCVCGTCHCVIKTGFNSLKPSNESEDDVLDKVWGLDLKSRLSCQICIADKDLVIEIPCYSKNHTRE
ncbi:2Fe-2S ferredoxin [Candidatus Ecksteinia adelgidicola]|nr:2Fe-2S ferredoxin [Candidatus Ecksteinia adelgidicola]